MIIEDKTKRPKVKCATLQPLCVGTNSQESTTVSQTLVLYDGNYNLSSGKPPTGLEPATNCLGNSSLSF